MEANKTNNYKNLIFPQCCGRKHTEQIAIWAINTHIHTHTERREKAGKFIIHFLYTNVTHHHQLLRWLKNIILGNKISFAHLPKKKKKMQRGEGEVENLHCTIFYYNHLSVFFYAFCSMFCM